MSLVDKLKKNSTVKETSQMSNSSFFNGESLISTPIPALNVALSGALDGGFGRGLTVFAGKSKHFKTLFSLILARSFLQKNSDGVLLFYDSEFGSPPSYFESVGIPLDRVVHTPVTNVEQLKFDIVKQLEGIERNDRVMIVVDSVGNLASKKEVEDAQNEKSVADMSRAKALKSLFRIVTPELTMRDVPMVVVNHTYETLEMFSKDVVSGGCVVAGTQIRTPEGLKNIEDFKVGDVVVTSIGEQRVSYVWDPTTLVEGNPECYEIEFEDGTTVTCSDKHMFEVEGQWVMARDLAVGMDCRSAE